MPGNHADGLGASIPAEAIEPDRLLMLEDGHCLKDHALSACNRPELRAEAQMLGTSLHTLVQMVDNDLGVTLLPEMAVVVQGDKILKLLEGGENHSSLQSINVHGIIYLIT